MQKYFIYLIFACSLLSCEAFSTQSDSYKLETENSVDSTDTQNAALIDEPDTLELRLRSLGLVDVQTLNANIWVDLKYSTEDNFMHANVYGGLRKAFLQQKPAEMLAQAQTYLTEKDSTLHLLVYDAVRPVWVQWKMWNMLDSIPVHQRVKFVSNPKNRSLHNFGAAVDLTICLESGEPLDMGAGFDDSREIAYPSRETYYLSKGLLTQQQIDNRKLLREVMKKAGFRNLETEWWHFNAMSRDAAKNKYKAVP